MAQAAVQGAKQRRVAGPHRQRAGLERGDLVGAVDVDAGKLRGRGDLADPVDLAEHAGGAGGQLGLLALDGAAVGHREQVGAQPVDLGQQLGLAGAGDAKHRHDGGDPDGDAER